MGTTKQLVWLLFFCLSARTSSASENEGETALRRRAKVSVREWDERALEEEPNAGSMRVSISIKTNEEATCTDEDLPIDFFTGLSEAVKLALMAERDHGPPDTGDLIIPANRWNQILQRAIRYINRNHGLKWQGRRGRAVDPDVQRGRRRLDEFCNYMCSSTGQDYWCECATTGRGRRRELTAAEGNTTHFEEQEDVFLPEQEQRYLQKKGGAEKKNAGGGKGQARNGGQGGGKTRDFDKRENVMGRFRERYPCTLLEMTMGETVAADYITEQIELGGIECLEAGYEPIVIIGFNMDEDCDT